MFATRARRGVENSRLGLDAAKSKMKGSAGGRGMNTDDEMISEEARAEVEQKEDEFVAQTEEAVGVMKNVCVFSFPFRSSRSEFGGSFGSIWLVINSVMILADRSSILPNRCVTSPT